MIFHRKQNHGHFTKSNTVECKRLYRSKFEEWKKHLRYQNPQIVILSETHWKEKYQAIFSAYKTFYLNRIDQRDVVAILTKKNFQAATLDLQLNENLEVVRITVKLKNNKKI